MASSLVQIRLDDELKSKAIALYDALGLDLPTAIRMFIKRSVMINGIPFSMTLSVNESGDYVATDALLSMQQINAAAQTAGTSDLTLEEINAEIDAARKQTKKECDSFK